MIRCDSVTRYVQDKSLGAAVFFETACVPRPKPLPENAPDRRTVSLRAAVGAMADRLMLADHASGYRDFSDLCSRALIAYAEARRPGILEDSIRELRESHALAAEPKQASYDAAPRVSAPTHLRPHVKTIVEKKRTA